MPSPLVYTAPHLRTQPRGPHAVRANCVRHCLGLFGPASSVLQTLGSSRACRARFDTHAIGIDERGRRCIRGGPADDLLLL